MPNSDLIRKCPQQNYLRICFNYDPATGALAWKQRPRDHFPTKRAWAIWNGRYADKPTGWINPDGYRVVSLDNTKYLAHRLIWKWMTGKEPPDNPDHANRNPSDNCWENLRAATQSQQNYNMKLLASKSGLRGVQRLPGGRYRARINDRHLGVFDTPEEAAIVADAARRELHGQFYRG